MPPEEHFKSPFEGDNDLAALVKRLSRCRDALVRRIEHFQKLAWAGFHPLSGSGSAKRPAIELLGAQAQSPSRPGDDYAATTRSLQAQATASPATGSRLSPDLSSRGDSIAAVKAFVQRQRDRYLHARPAGTAARRESSSLLPTAIQKLRAPVATRRFPQSAGAAGRIFADGLLFRGPTSSLRQSVARLQALEPGRTAVPGRSPSGPAASRKAAATKTPIPALRLKGYPDTDGHGGPEPRRSLRKLWAEHEALKDRVETQEPPTPTWQ